MKILAPETSCLFVLKVRRAAVESIYFQKFTFKRCREKQIKGWSGAAVYYCIIPAESKFNYRGRSSRCTIARALLNSSGKSNSVGLHFPGFHLITNLLGLVCDIEFDNPLFTRHTCFKVLLKKKKKKKRFISLRVGAFFKFSFLKAHESVSNIFWILLIRYFILLLSKFSFRLNDESMNRQSLDFLFT